MSEFISIALLHVDGASSARKPMTLYVLWNIRMFVRKKRSRTNQHDWLKNNIEKNGTYLTNTIPPRT